MGHTPYGYSIVNGCVTINEGEANKIRKLYENYLSGMARPRLLPLLASKPITARQSV